MSVVFAVAETVNLRGDGGRVPVEDVLIFANPIAGRGRGEALARNLEARFKADGLGARVLMDRPGRLLAGDVAGPVRAAVVIGGDGTLRAVADQLLKLRPEDFPPLLPVPLGTANLMVRHLGFRWSRPQLVEGISNAVHARRVRMLDAGRANGRLFLVMVGVGIDAHIVHELDRLRQGPITFFSYLAPAAMTLRNFDFAPLQVAVDGREVWSGEPGVAFVGNVKEYGAGFPVLPFARPDDGLLDVCLLPCRTRTDLIRLFLHAAAGEHFLSEDAMYLRGREVTIASDREAPVQMDGDPVGHTPVEIGLLPVQLPFIVP
ncbi:MAG TPA: diacylglycerol kinase family protein [Tepidisphaeraceae bacterium]|jgi:diacylglycerol kinase family enzyme|nr:diacylglycerol kinase family protein [Tepidisphaeraceae bacterium]